jgi:hypothetical protein
VNENKKRRAEEIKAELLAIEERDRQAKEELKRATGTVEKLSGGKIPETLEEVEIQKEIENLSPEDKEKIGWGLNTIGFKAEKAKNDIFAWVFNKALKLKDVDPKGTTGKFCKEALDGFVRNSKIATKKANDTSAFTDTKLGVYIKGQKRGIGISAGKQKFASNVGNFSGNVLKYGRLIADATGLTVGAAHRLAMTAGMGTAWLAETGKETHFKNEKVISKTRIGKDITRESSAEEAMQFLKDNPKDIEKAEEEAWKIYENAGGTFENDREGNRIWKANDLSAEALKNAYLMEIPKDLQKRLQNPSLANNFILRFAQRALRRELLGYKIEDHLIFEGSISRLNKKIEEKENNKKLTPEQKKIEIEKLITKQKKNLEDYDRMITQSGIIDGVAMGLRYAQTAGKATVAVLQVETLALSVKKMFEGISHLLTSHDIHPIKTAPLTTTLTSTEQIDPFTAEHTDAKPGQVEEPSKLIIPKSVPEAPAGPAPTEAPNVTPQPTASAPIIPETPPIISNFANEGIKFENGKGGIQGILDLKQQIAEQYHGDYSKAPDSVQDFMKTDAIEEAKKLGLYDPNNPNESALIQEGSTLKFDEKGGLIFHDAKTGENFTHYEGKMFDSDGSAKVSTVEHETKIPPESEAPKTLAPEQPDHTPATTPTSETPPVEPAPTPKPTPEELTEKIKTQIDVETAKTSIADSIINKPGPGYQTVRMGTTYKTGNVMSVGNKFNIGNVMHMGNEMQMGRGILNQDQFTDISHENNILLKQNTAFAENPYNLSGGKLMEVYETINKDLGYVFGKDPSSWSKLSSTLKERADEILIYQEHPSGDGVADKLSSYLNILKNHADLKPKGGFLGMGAENSEHFIARCLQKLSKTGELEIFEKNLRKQ